MRRPTPKFAHGPAPKAALSLAILLWSWTSGLSQWSVRQVAAASSVAAAAPTNASARSASGAVPLKSLEEKLAEARGQLAALGDTGLTNGAAAASQDLALRRSVLHRLVRLYEQHLSNTAALEKARLRKAEMAREAQSWTRFAEPPPYSILLADRLREELQGEQQKVGHGEAAIAVLSQLIEENRGALRVNEEKIRRYNEQLEEAKDRTLMARLSARRELERLRSQASTAGIAVLDSERQATQEEVAISRIRLGLLQRQLVFAQNGAQFTQADLETITGQLDRHRDQLEQELAEAQPRHRAAQQALAAARDAARAPELVAVRETQLDVADTVIYVLRLMLEGASVERTMWELRLAAYGSDSVETLRDSERRMRSFTYRRDLWRDYARQQLEAVSSRQQLYEGRLNSLPVSSELRPIASERLDALREQELVLLRFMRTLDRVDHLTERWAEDLRTAEGKLPITSRVQKTFFDARSLLKKLWYFEIFSVEDTITVDDQKITGRRSITIGKLVLAVVILVVGIWVTGWLTRLVEPIFIRRFKIEANQARLIRRWLRALMIVCLVLFSLTSVKIPLTVFAFAGGALAIGLGFGTQNILKNFVSGLILLFERPFRVGDVLDVGGQKGALTSIGLRASVLQLWDGTETLIPNSFLLENNVNNWTYTSRAVRFTVSVGVAYGSDPRQVIQLLSEVAERHGLVEKEPKPHVLFTEFGESALLFELRFWVDVAKANAAQVSSDLRLMIANAFAEQGLVIAFPQRNLHLHAAHPLPVQVVAAAEKRLEPGNGSTQAGDDGKPLLVS